MDLRGDFLVIGSGIAGLRAAISLADAGQVIVLTKADPRESNTGYAQGGIAVALGPGDSPELHGRDTMAAGDGLCDPDAVDVLVREGPRYVQELVDWGAAFDRGADGTLAFGREAAHSVRRVLHATDATGREISGLLWSRVAANGRIRVINDALATDLQTSGGECTGAAFVTSNGQRASVSASRTLLATGGAGQVFRETTNPWIATGDGIAMAASAGARVTDLEFVQFHPTSLHVEGAPRFLLSEALRGEGARLINESGEAFVSKYAPAGDLASRDLVARAIVKEAARTGSPIYLTMAHLDPSFVVHRFPTIARACAEAGLDLARDRIPISPAAHYVMGGVETDLDGRTSVAGLFAAGEVACTGVHGANRLASNSLLEGLVFGARAAGAMKSPQRAARLRTADVVSWPAAPTSLRQGRVALRPDKPVLTGRTAKSVRPGGPPELQRRRTPLAAKAGSASAAPSDSVPSPADVRDLMWRHVGLVRERRSLEPAVAHLAAWSEAIAKAGAARLADHEVRRLRSLVTVGLLIARAALRREESRGAHFRTDFPARDDLHWKRHVSEVWT